MGDKAIELIFKNANSLPFDELIRQLNGGYYLDTFEVGSVKIAEISRPNLPRMKTKADIVDEILNRPWIDPSKFEDKTCKIPKKEIRMLGVKKQTGASEITMSKKEVGCPGKLFKDDDQSEVRRILDEMLGSDLPPLLDNLDHSCIIQEKKSYIPSSISKNDRTNSRSVIKRVFVSSATPIKKATSDLSGVTSNNDDEEIKLECTRRKLKRQYDEIESEKKRRKIQIIKPQKPLVTDQRQVGQRAKRAPAARKQQSKRLKLDSKFFI